MSNSYTEKEIWALQTEKNPVLRVLAVLIGSSAETVWDGSHRHLRWRVVASGG